MIKADVAPTGPFSLGTIVPALQITTYLYLTSVKDSADLCLEAYAYVLVQSYYLLASVKLVYDPNAVSALLSKHHILARQKCRELSLQPR